ncbi:Reverse transcriptase (RNA-dependent DNA polymerase) [Fragilaria crotonensis]|nr:Reverse transcriptase (RNA-dependent DNA polymerase) [Fragilaria crotonensis]
MVGSLHQTWNDHVLTPTVDHNSWPLRISISQKRARNKTPQRQGTEPFHRLHLDLMRNPFRYGLTTNSNYSAYLFIVTTPGKLTGWIGLPTESTTSILIALKQWLTDTELLGRTQSVRFIRTDAGSAFTSTKFISECTSLGIKVEAAAPEHQEMNGICEAKWREVHNTANILLNNARLGGAFFHHAHAYAVQILNLPTQAFHCQLRVFGCPTFFKRYEPTFRNKLITYKQQLQRASGIFLGFPDNSAGWLVYSPDQPQSLVITRDAYFDEDFNSALCFDSKPFAGAVPIRSHFNPNGLCNTPENSEPSTFHQTGSAANLGNPPSTFIDDTNPLPSLTAIPESTDDNTDEQPPGTMPNPTHADHYNEAIIQHGPTPPTPHQINFVTHQQHHSQLHKMMTIYFQECNEDLPTIDPIHSAMMTIDNSPATIHKPTPGTCGQIPSRTTISESCPQT